MNLSHWNCTCVSGVSQANNGFRGLQVCPDGNWAFGMGDAHISSFRNCPASDQGFNQLPRIKSYSLVHLFWWLKRNEWEPQHNFRFWRPGIWRHSEAKDCLMDVGPVPDIANVKYVVYKYNNIYIYTVTTSKYVEGGPDREALEVVWNTSSYI